jgi:hypothetical protein
MALKFDTVEARYLVYVYVGVWVVQGGYFGRIVWQWFHARKPVGSK